MTTAYIYTPLREETIQKMSQNYYLDVSLTCQKVEQGIVLPYRGVYHGKTAGGVIDNAGVFIDNSGLHENHSGDYPCLQSEVKYSEDTAIYIGMFFPIWGHCLTDCLKKLWFLGTAEGKALLQQGCKLVCVVMMGDKFAFSQTFRDLLATLNVNLDQIEVVKQPTRYKTIYIPDDALQRKGEDIYHTSAFAQLRNRIIENISDSSCKTYDKVYFSRAHFQQGKQDIGERQIERVFRYLGYKIVYPETLSFAEQVRLLRHCTHFASTEGSISHNAMFCRKGTKVCIIRKGAYLNNYQFMINHLCELEVTYVDAHLSILVDKDRVWNGPFFLYANRNLLQFAKLPTALNGFSMHAFRKYMQKAYAKQREQILFSDYYTKRLLDELLVTYFESNLLKRLFRSLCRCNLHLGVLICKILHKL